MSQTKEYIITIQKVIKVNADSKRLARKEVTRLYSESMAESYGCGVDGYYHVWPYKKTKIVSIEER